MERTKLATFAAAALTLLLAGAPARATMGAPVAANSDPAERLENQLLTLGLDDKTRKEVFAILDGARPEARELRVSIHNAQQHLGELLKKDKPDEVDVLKQVDEVGKLITELHKKELAALLEVRAKLTPEQRAKLRPARQAAALSDGHGKGAPDHTMPGKPQGGCEKRAGRSRTISLGIAPL